MRKLHFSLVCSLLCLSMAGATPIFFSPKVQLPASVVQSSESVCEPYAKNYRSAFSTITPVVPKIVCYTGKIAPSAFMTYVVRGIINDGGTFAGARQTFEKNQNVQTISWLWKDSLIGTIFTWMENSDKIVMVVIKAEP